MIHATAVYDGLWRPFLREVVDAIENACDYNATLRLLVHDHGTHVELFIPDGFGGHLRQTVTSAEEAAEYAGAWARELGIDAHGNYAPKVGMAATRHVGSDRYAVEVWRISKSGKTIRTKDVHSGHSQAWRRSTRAGRTCGLWRSGPQWLTIGAADEHLDPSF